MAELPLKRKRSVLSDMGGCLSPFGDPGEGKYLDLYYTRESK